MAEQVQTCELYNQRGFWGSGSGGGGEHLARGQVYKVSFATVFGVRSKAAKWERRSVPTGERGSGKV